MAGSTLSMPAIRILEAERKVRLATFDTLFVVSSAAVGAEI